MGIPIHGQPVIAEVQIVQLSLKLTTFFEATVAWHPSP